jgi:hypothetical protein
MDWLRHSFQRFRVLFSGALDNDLDVEMASHLEMAVEENRNNGMSPEEARRQALLKFGGSTCAKEEHRLGIYAVISYSVTRQTQEIGIRMALGASPKRVQWSVLCKTLRLALMGMAIGALASFAASKLIASLLFNIEASDPATFVGVLLLLLAISLLAGYLPAFRATRVDPTTAIAV